MRTMEGWVYCVIYLLVILLSLSGLMRSYSDDPLMMMGLQVSSVIVMSIMLGVVMICLQDSMRGE